MSKTTTKKQKVTLKSSEAYTRDVGRGVARIDYNTMDVLDISTGDIIEIKGKKTTVAKALPLYPSDENKSLIRIDGLGRTNSGIAIGDTIAVRKIKAVAAEKVVVAPLEAIPPIDERYLADALEGVALNKNSVFMVPYFGGRITFAVKKITPKTDAVVITTKTNFEILTIYADKTNKQNTSNFFSDLQELYFKEFDSFKKCLHDKKIFNELVGKLLTKTEGRLSPVNAIKFVECLGDLSKQ
jgi:hypothetical protein